jgi:hypothetical protein
MKREEREQLLKDTLLYFAPKDRYVTDEEGNVYYREDVTLKAMELSEHPLPPAEGAAVAYYPLSFITDAIASEHQPTAEGAEDLKQYMTNLLYSAYDKGAKQIEPPESERIELDKWVEEMINGIDEYFKSEQSTAEGAEEIKQAICDEIQKSLNGAKLKHIFTDDEDAMPLVDFLSTGDTIAEGQEEIENLVEQIYFDMDSWPSFATLHAQKIADKMASERQREMWLNMQYYMEYCQYKGYVTPQEWIEKHKHF